MKQRVADFICEQLYLAGGKHVFIITGGMIMHLSDALLLNKKQRYTCCHHEQAAVMAAEAYGRYTGKLGVAFVTAGPGALNTLTGVVGAYVDSSPCIIVAGQSKVSQAKVTGPRQFALQGFNTKPLFEKVTKYAVMLDDITKVRYEVEKCIYIAKENRVGPVWIECPVDIQGALFNPQDHEGFIPPQKKTFEIIDENTIEQAKRLLFSSKRPCVLAGAGVRLSGAVSLLHNFINKTNIPIITSRLGMDLVGHDNPLFVGRPGTYGDRPANFTVNNCDLLVTIGCRMGIGLVGHDFQSFAPRAKKIMVDVDEKELSKPSVVPDLPIMADAKFFLNAFMRSLGGYRCANAAWISQTQQWKNIYPVDMPEYLQEKKGINSYHFMRVFSEKMDKDSVFVLDTGSCFHVHAQAFKVKYGQRHIITGGLSTMGYVPAVIGVARACGKEVYCISGDGSLQMNLQELQTIIGNKLPVKLIVFNNNGYLLIRHTHTNFLEGRLIGESPKSGVTFPDLQKISQAYGISYIKISSNDELDSKIELLKESDSPVLCEVFTPPWQLLIPRVASKKLEDGTMVSMPYDDMFPFLSREEYQNNCVFDKM